jgi:tripartite-type tricarboxylate transporter receptor subunit TctC
MRRRTTIALIAAATMAMTGGLASAQNYPERRITFVVPYPAGGATDVSARLLATKLSEAWKQPVVIENKPGGGGNVGNDYVAKAAGDGYTVLIAITQIIQAPSLYANLTYNAFKDLAPVSQVALSTVVLGVPASQPIRTVKELVDYAKTNPGKPYGSFGNATTSHLYGELLKKDAGIDMTHVPYRGSAPLLNDMIGNQITAGFIDLTTVGSQIAAGNVRALAVGGEKRRSFLPDTPTLAELGFPGFEAEGWVGVFVPASTPKPVVEKLSAELDRIIKDADTVKKLEAVSLMPVGGTADAFAAALRRDAARWADIAKTVGVKAE